MSIIENDCPSLGLYHFAIHISIRYQIISWLVFFFTCEADFKQWIEKMFCFWIFKWLIFVNVFLSYTCTTAVLDVVDVAAPGVRGPEAESVAWFISVDSWWSKKWRKICIGIFKLILKSHLFQKVAWIWSHHPHLPLKFKSRAGKLFKNPGFKLCLPFLF